nr:scavenger receptor class F member 1-like [Crassostrea gigas]
MYCNVKWIIYLSLGHISFAAICTRNGKYVCCSGYKMNKTSGNCDKCPPGYTGVDCAYRCHYPTYGEDCFMTCECPAETCDFMSGCKDTSTAGTRMSSFKNRKLIPKKLETSFTYPTMTSGGLSEESTDTGSDSPPTFLVFYTTVALISLFVFFSLIYLLSYLRKMFISRQKRKTSDPQFTNKSNSLYECVEFPHHM